MEQNKTAASFLACAMVALLGAAPAPDASPSAGPPMMRVSFVKGDVLLARRDEHGKLVTSAASLNDPLQAGDSLSTGKDAQAEIQLDGATAARVSSNSQLTVEKADSAKREIVLNQGTLQLALARSGDIENELVGTSTDFTTRQAGEYRFDAAKGLVPARRDQFEGFNADRDRVALDARSNAQYVPSELAGYDNLGSYGTWKDVAKYGHVWVPQEAATSTWAPYRTGQWSWQKNYGWTWVGRERWGWVPYHFGNWVYLTGRGWAWCPPTIGSPFYWVPAMVGFFGITGSYGSCAANVGWVALAPGEPYYAWNYPYPWYPATYYYNCTHPVHPTYPIGFSRRFANLNYGGASTITHGIVPYRPKPIVPHPGPTLAPPHIVAPPFPPIRPSPAVYRPPA